MAGSQGSPSSFDAFDRFAADQRVQEAARARARRSSLEVQADEEATLRGVLLDLGERAAEVHLELDAGRALTGVVVHVGMDHLEVHARDGRTVFVALAAVHAVLPLDAGDAVRGTRTLSPGSADTLHHVLHDLAGERSPVLVRLRSGATVEGELRSVGQDVATLLVDGQPRRRGHVSLGAVAEVWCSVAGS